MLWIDEIFTLWWIISIVNINKNFIKTEFVDGNYGKHLSDDRCGHSDGNKLNGTNRDVMYNEKNKNISNK
jgi:hypothetical protein